MPIRVRIPAPLRRLTDNQPEVQGTGIDILSLIEDLEGKYPGIKARLCDEAGEIRRFINIYVNGEDIRFLQGKSTALKDGDDVSVLPAIAGG